MNPHDLADISGEICESKTHGDTAQGFSCRRFCAEKASDFNKSQQLPISSSQQVQYQSLKNREFQQVSIGSGIWFGTRGAICRPTFTNSRSAGTLTYNGKPAIARWSLIAPCLTHPQLPVGFSYLCLFPCLMMMSTCCSRSIWCNTSPRTAMTSAYLPSLTVPTSFSTFINTEGQ